MAPMNGSTLLSIGELSRRTGLTVGTIRFYSDAGLVAPIERSPAGYRRYSTDAVARLTLVRTLRDLGLDLTSVRGVLDRDLTLRQVAETHADAMAVQIRMLQMRHAVLTRLAESDGDLDDVELVSHVTAQSDSEHRRLIDQFLDTVFDDLDIAHAGVRRSMTPDLPDDASPTQVQAWEELTRLSLDPEFRGHLRQMARDHAAEQGRDRAGPPRPDLGAVVRDLADEALAHGIDPSSADADPTVAAITAQYAALVGSPDDHELRTRLLTRLHTIGDPRKDQYARLLATVNGWPAPLPLAPAVAWAISAVQRRAHATGS